MNTLDDFMKWAKEHGHAGYLQKYVDNYHACMQQRKEMEQEAVRQRQGD